MYPSQRLQTSLPRMGTMPLLGVNDAGGVRLVTVVRQNANGDDWHNVRQARVGLGSTFTIVHRVTVPGTKVFRILIPGGPENQRGVSSPMTVTVTPNATPLT